MAVINFGKHSGTELSECPQDYLFWLATQDSDIIRDGKNWSNAARAVLPAAERIENNAYQGKFSLRTGMVLGTVQVINYSGEGPKYYLTFQTRKGRHLDFASKVYPEAKEAKEALLRLTPLVSKAVSASEKGDADTAKKLAREIKEEGNGVDD